jgi:acyl-CoA dehydrogenase
MDFAFDDRTEQLRGALLAFMDAHVYPAEPEFERTDPEAPFSWERPKIMAELRAEARRRGLWNLFLPDAERGAGLTNLQYAPLAEITGRSPQVAPEALNCAAPDTGQHGAAAPARHPGTAATVAPATARGRDPFGLLDDRAGRRLVRRVQHRAADDADRRRRVRPGRPQVVVDRRDERRLRAAGRHGGQRARRSPPPAALDPAGAARHPGVQIRRGLSAFGYWDETHGGHAEVAFDEVRVGPEALLGERGRGFALAQARLGPGRIHHCMRLIGMAERAFDLMCRRVLHRVAFGRPLAEQGVVRETIADCRIRLEQLRLQVLRCAWLIDTVGAQDAATEISAIKVAAPATAQWVIDKAIHVHGAGGMSADHPLAMLWAQARGLRFADGPDEVHRMVLARRELERYRT